MQLVVTGLFNLDVAGITIGLYSLNPLKNALLAGNKQKAKCGRPFTSKVTKKLKTEKTTEKNALDMETPYLGFSLISPISELCDFGQVPPLCEPQFCYLQNGRMLISPGLCPRVTARVI